ADARIDLTRVRRRHSAERMSKRADPGEIEAAGKRERRALLVQPNELVDHESDVARMPLELIEIQFALERRHGRPSLSVVRHRASVWKRRDDSVIRMGDRDHDIAVTG